MNVLFSFDFYMVYIPECKQQLRPWNNTRRFVLLSFFYKNQKLLTLREHTFCFWWGPYCSSSHRIVLWCAGLSFPVFDFSVSLTFIFKRNMIHLCEWWFIITLCYLVFVLCLECPMSTGFSFSAFDFFISLIFIFKRNMLHVCEWWFIITLCYLVLVLCLLCPVSTWLSTLDLFDFSISPTFIFKRNMIHLCEWWSIITLCYLVLVLCHVCPVSTWLSILDFLIFLYFSNVYFQTEHDTFVWVMIHHYSVLLSLSPVSFVPSVYLIVHSWFIWFLYFSNVYFQTEHDAFVRVMIHHYSVLLSFRPVSCVSSVYLIVYS
jgi:hypothetical protein